MRCAAQHACSLALLARTGADAAVLVAVLVIGSRQLCQSPRQPISKASSVGLTAAGCVAQGLISFLTRRPGVKEGLRSACNGERG